MLEPQKHSIEDRERGDPAKDPDNSDGRPDGQPYQPRDGEYKQDDNLEMEEPLRVPPPDYIPGIYRDAGARENQEGVHRPEGGDGYPFFTRDGVDPGHEIAQAGKNKRNGNPRPRSDAELFLLRREQFRRETRRIGNHLVSPFRVEIDTMLVSAALPFSPLFVPTNSAFCPYKDASAIPGYLMTCSLSAPDDSASAAGCNDGVR